MKNLSFSSVQSSSVAQSCPTLCEPMNCMQHARPPFPSPTPRDYPNSYPLSWWYHPTISSSVLRFSSWPQSFPASGSFPRSQLFASGSQSIGASTSASILPMNIQGWFGMANHFSILTVRAPQSVWKGKKIGIILRRVSHTIYMTRWEQLQIGFMQKKIQKNRIFSNSQIGFMQKRIQKK